MLCWDLMNDRVLLLRSLQLCRDCQTCARTCWSSSTDGEHACAGAAREGVVTYTKLDASQGPWSVRPSMQSVPDSGLSGSQPGGSAPDQGAPGSQGSAGVHLPKSAAHRGARQEPAADGAQAGSQPLKPAAASVSNASAGVGQEDPGFLEPSPWRVKRRKENSAPSSPEQLAKHAGQGLFAGTPASSSLGHRAAGQHDSLFAHQEHAFSQEAAAAGKSLMAALRAAGISPRSSDASRPSDAQPDSDKTGPLKAQHLAHP